MSPLALPSALEIVASAAKELLDHRLSEHNIVWIVKTAVIVEALKRARGNKSRAARMLGIHRNLLSYQIQEFALNGFVGEERRVADLQLALFNQKRPAASVGERNKVLSHGASA